jgi:hypothetical protein
LVNGAPYIFRVAAEDTAGNRSSFSAPVTATPEPARAPPATPEGLNASAQDAQVVLTWIANPEADLAGYTLHYGSDPDAPQSRLELSRDAVSAAVDGLINGRTYHFALEAKNVAGQTSPRSAPVAATPQASLFAPVVTSVAIAGHGDSAQVRQGAGSIEVTLTGERLENLAAVRLLGAFDFAILESAPTSARLTAVVPAGLVVGPRTLLVSSDAGDTAVADAIEITKITAAKTPGLNPSDETGLGTPNRPFLTLTKALSVAGAGDTVLLGAGIYGAGERWPQGGVVPIPNVPAGVTIEGQSSDRGAVLLEGPGAGSQTDGLAFAGNATVRNVSLRGFRYALYLGIGAQAARRGELTVENVAAFDNFVGLWVTLAERLEVVNSAFRNNVLNGNSGYGLFVQAVATASLRDTEVIGNYLGLRLTNTATPLVASASLTGMILSENMQGGLRLTSVSLSMANTRIAGNSGDGLNMSGRPGFLALRGGTVLEGNSGVQLVDARDANQGTFSVTRYALPNSGVTVGAVVGPAQLGSYYRIVNAGNGFLFQ